MPWRGRAPLQYATYARDPPEMALVQDDTVVQTLAAKTPEEACTNRMRQRSLVWRAEYVDPAARCHPGKRRAESRIVVADVKPGALVEGRGLRRLLGRPEIG
jgi:hypothetical protein